MNKKDLIEEANEFAREESENAKSLDKSILTLSAGALLLSITFISQTINASPIKLELIFLSWALFSLSIISCLMGYMFSRYYHRIGSDIIWEMIEKKIKKHSESESFKKFKTFSLLTTVFTILPLIFFCLATLLLLFFCGLNINNTYL